MTISHRCCSCTAWACAGRAMARFLSYPVARCAHVFEGFGVGLTVTEVGRAAPGGMLPAGVVARPSRLSDLLPASSRSDCGDRAGAGPDRGAGGGADGLPGG